MHVVLVLSLYVVPVLFAPADVAIEELTHGAVEELTRSAEVAVEELAQGSMVVAHLMAVHK